MNRTLIGVLATALALIVVALGILRTEPVVGPVLAIASPPQETASEVSTDPEDFQPDAIAATVPDSTTAEAVASAPIAKERSEQVRQLIRKLKPRQTKSAIDVWVKEFEHMGDDEIVFLMQQSTTLGSSNGLDVLSSFESDGLISEPTFELPPLNSPIRPKNLPVADVLRRNLQNTSTIGYRERLELKVLSAGRSADPVQVSLYQMNCGELILTGNPLHLALRNSGPVFFPLADGRLTRNGLFVRMDNGQLGLQAGEDSIALQDSPRLPSIEHWTISSDGQVFDGGNEPIGTIAVVRVAKAEMLTTEDGVYFRTEAGVTPVDDFLLETGALELSNVDILRNRERLDWILTREIGTID